MRDYTIFDHQRELGRVSEQSLTVSVRVTTHMDEEWANDGAYKRAKTLSEHVVGPGSSALHKIYDYPGAFGS